jgi:hypothetical protein
MLWPMPVRSGHFGARDRNDDRHQAHHERHADREVREGLRIPQHIFGADESSAPEHDENRRRRARGNFFEVAGHLEPLLPDRMLCGKN